MFIRVRDTVYPDVHAAADALGVKVSTIWTAIKRGREEMIGLGAGRHRKARKHYGGGEGGRPPKDLTLAGQTFASYSDLSRWLGKNRRYVATKLSRDHAKGMADLEQEVLGRLMAGSAKREENASRVLSMILSDGIDKKAKTMGGTVPNRYNWDDETDTPLQRVAP